MKRKIISFTIIMAGLFLANSCTKDYLIDVKGSLSGIVRNLVTNELMQGVTVQVYVDTDGTGFSTTSNENGFFNITGIPVGDYIVVYSKDGFARYRATISVYPYFYEGTANTTKGKQQGYTVGLVRNADMAPLTGKANGLVKYHGQPAGGVTVKVYYGSNQIDNFVMETTTDASGYYAFNALPLNIALTLTSISGAASGAQNATIGLVNEVQPFPVGDINLNENALKILSYTGQNGELVDTAATIEVVFSEDISEAITKMKGGFVFLTRGAPVGANISYSGNKIIIQPLETLSSDTDYGIAISNLFSSEIKSISSTQTFTTVNRPIGTITGKPVLNISGGFLQIVGAKPTGPYPIEYLIWANYPDDDINEFILAGEADFADPGESIVAFPSGTKFYVVPFMNQYGVVLGEASDIITKP